ncbi:MAG TPA: hypothetical protein VML55_15105 [Planctomycetaceae bacterium]|nr:hypothetical protein [Planctomycetaceae bacterium]
MSHELLYTSAPEGLRPGTRGLCTVELTDRIPPALVDRLEALSGHYCRSFPRSDPQAGQTLVQWSHLILDSAGERYHVLSRVAEFRAGQTGRARTLVHNVALPPDERPAGNPASVLASKGFAKTRWDGKPRLLPAGRKPPSGARPPGVCHAWQQASGDAGWAGVVAANALQPGGRVLNVIVPAGLDVLPLVDEALALVPPDRQWNVTFSTHYAGLPSGVECRWRFVADGTPEARSLRNSGREDVLDLCTGPGAPPAGEFVEAARTGTVPRIPDAAQPAAEEAALVPLEPVDEPPAVRGPDEPHEPAHGPGERRRRSARPPQGLEAALDDDDVKPHAGYTLGEAALQQRRSKPAKTFGDPRVTRSLDDLVVGRHDAKSRDGRRLPIAGLLVVVALGSVVAFITSGGLDSSQQPDESQPSARQPGYSSRIRAAAEPQPAPVAARPTAVPLQNSGAIPLGTPNARTSQPPRAASQTDPPQTDETPAGEHAIADAPAIGAGAAAEAGTVPADPPQPPPQRAGVTYIAGWDADDVEFIADGTDVEAESQAPPLRPGDRLIVLPGCTANVLMKNGGQTVEATLLGSAGAVFAAAERSDAADRRQTVELLAGRVVLVNASGSEVRLDVLYHGPGNRRQESGVLLPRRGDRAGAEIIPSRNPAAAPRFVVHGDRPPQAATQPVPGGGIPLGGIPLGGNAPAGKPPWITARIQRGEMPLRDVLRSAGLEPGVQPLTQELRSELIEKLEKAVRDLDRDIRPAQRRPTRPPRPGQPNPMQLRETRKQLAEECLQLLDALTAGEAGADSRSDAAEPSGRDESP